MHDDHGDSLELIEALPHLTEDELGHLTAAIRGWEMYLRARGRGTRSELRLRRGHRFRLLAALPPNASRTRCDWRLTPSAVTHCRITSGQRPMRTESDSSAVRFRTPRWRSGRTPTSSACSTNSDSTERTPDWLAKPFPCELRSSQGVPERALAIVEQLYPGEQERPAAYAVRGSPGGETPHTGSHRLVKQLDNRGFVGQDLGRQSLLPRRTWLGPMACPEAACDLLHRWRLADWTNNDRDEAEREDGDNARCRQASSGATAEW